MPKKAKEGSTVSVEFEGKLEDGTVFDKSKPDQPLVFTIGEHRIIPAFEKAVEGMSVGEKKEINLNPKDAFGERKEELVIGIPKSNFPHDLELKEGALIRVGLPNGMQAPAKIVKIAEDVVVLDMNHPLAGKKVSFKIKLIDTN